MCVCVKPHRLKVCEGWSRRNVWTGTSICSPPLLPGGSSTHGPSRGGLRHDYSGAALVQSAVPHLSTGVWGGTLVCVCGGGYILHKNNNFQMYPCITIVIVIGLVFFCWRWRCMGAQYSFCLFGHFPYLVQKRQHTVGSGETPHV
jgi:hypothetical protein